MDSSTGTELGNYGDERTYGKMSQISKRIGITKRLLIRIKNGQIFPVYARKYVTMEEVLAARVGKGRSGKKKGKTISEPTTIATYMINIEERMQAENDVLEHQNSKNCS